MATTGAGGATTSATASASNAGGGGAGGMDGAGGVGGGGEVGGAGGVCGAGGSEAATVAQASVSSAGGGPAVYSGTPIVFVNGQSNATAGYWASAAVYNGPDLVTWDGAKWATAFADLGGDNVLGTGPWAGRLTRSLMKGGDTGRVQNLGWPGKAIAYFLPTSLDVAIINGTLDAMNRNNYAVARAMWTDAGYEPHLIGWAQGEADGGRSKTAYHADLTALIAAWTKDFPALERVLLLKTAASACGADTSGVRAAQEQVASENALVSLVSADDLTGVALYHGGCHYTLSGYDLIADRMLAALK